MESDSVQMYLSEYSYNISIKEEIPLQEMYKEYKYFCEDNGFKACSLRTLADRLRNSGYKTERKKYGTIVNAEKKDCF